MSTMEANDTEKQPTKAEPQVYLQGNQYVDHPSEAIWSVYLSEAEPHDKALASAWKSDMGAILIFAGLFSAVVTAFIIESYKTLKQDQGDVTIALLAQISNQLANGTNAIILSPTPDKAQFEVPNSALRVNVLWFLSLTFSLASALVATLVQQWSRNYLDAIQRRPRPYKRARIRSYLHEGLKKYGMFTVVKTIPTLLHIPLFLFLGGLFEFLRPINRSISYLVLGILIVCGTLYIGTAITSVVSRNCPYRIPVSGIFWRILNLSRWLYRRFNPRHVPGAPIKLPGNMAEEAEILSMKEHRYRDLSAIEWTLESLTDSTELEPFVEGISGFVVSPDIPQMDAATILVEIFSNKEFDLAYQITQLLESCYQILEPSRRQKRRVACLSAMWTLASLSVTHKRHFYLPFGLIFDDQQPDWLGSPTIEAHWARCLGTLLSCILFAEGHPPKIDANNERWLGLISFLSNIPSLQSLSLQLRKDLYGLTSSEYRILALIGFLVAPIEGPFDPLAISQHPMSDASIFSPSLLNVATHQLTTASVQPRIQAAFGRAVSRTLMHSHPWHVHSELFKALGPLIDGLDDPAAIRIAVAGMEGCISAGKLTPSRVETHILNLKAKLTSDDVGGATDRAGGKQGGEGKESIENLGMRGSEWDEAEGIWQGEVDIEGQLVQLPR